MSKKRVSWLGMGFIACVGLLQKLRPRLWGWWYNRLAQRDEAGLLRFMNYGFSDPLYDAVPFLAPDEPFRFPMQLYFYTLKDVPMRGASLVEVGSGRGGGAIAVTRYLQPERYTAIDLSAKAVAWCQRYYATHEPQIAEKISWLQGSADALPLANNTADIVLNVESSHCYPDMRAFTDEVFRVLVAGGVFALCDIRTPAGVREVEESIMQSGLVIQSRQTISRQVLASLDQLSAIREKQLLPMINPLFRSAFRDFIALKDTELYNRLRAGELEYISLQAIKPGAGSA